MSVRKYTLHSGEAYEGVLARFLGSFQKKLLLYTDVAQQDSNPTTSSLMNFRPSPYDKFQEGSIPSATLHQASLRQAEEKRRKITSKAKSRAQLGTHHAPLSPSAADGAAHHADTHPRTGERESSSDHPGAASVDGGTGAGVGGAPGARGAEDSASSLAPTGDGSPRRGILLAGALSPSSEHVQFDEASLLPVKRTQHGTDGPDHKPHGKGKGHGKHVHHHQHKRFRPEVSHRELFFDLIYVVVCIELGTFLHHHISWTQLGYTFLLFVSFWLDWFHTNVINSYIRVTNPWTALFMLVVIGALGLAAHAISVGQSEGEGPDTVAVGPLSTHRVAGAIFLLLPRLAFLAIYANIWYFTDLVYDSFAQTRKLQSGLFCLCFLTTTALCIAMACVRDEGAVLALWIVLTCLEVLVYLVSSLIIDPVLQWKVAPAFAKERDTVWVFLVLGESIISLGMYGQHKDLDYYFDLILGFLLIYSVMRMFLLSQPTKSDVIRHALYGSAFWVFCRNICLMSMSFGLLCIGVGLKSIMLSGEELWTRHDALLLTCGLACALFFMHLCRFTHLFVVSDDDPRVYGIEYNAAFGRYRRYAVWGLQALLSLGFIPLGLVVDDEGAGLSPPRLLGILLGCMVGMGLIDLASRPTEVERELLLRMHTPLRLADLMAGYEEPPPRPSTLPPGRALTPEQSARARRRWTLLFNGFRTCLYAEKKYDTLDRYSSHELVRPGLGHRGRQSQLETIFDDAVINRGRVRLDSKQGAVHLRRRPGKGSTAPGNGTTSPPARSTALSPPPAHGASSPESRPIVLRATTQPLSTGTHANESHSESLV